MRIERNVVMGNAGVDQSPSLLDPLAAETGKQHHIPASSIRSRQASHHISLSIGPPHTATSSVRWTPLSLCPTLASIVYRGASI